MKQLAVTTNTLGSLYAEMRPGGHDKTGLAEALEAAIEWPDIPTGFERAPTAVRTKHSSFVLFLARATGEDQNRIAEAMADDENVAGRVLRSIEQRLREQKGGSYGKAGRPPSVDPFMAQFLNALFPDQPANQRWMKVPAGRLPENQRWKKVSASMERFGAQLLPEQLKEQARKFRRKTRAD